MFFKSSANEAKDIKNPKNYIQNSSTPNLEPLILNYKVLCRSFCTVVQFPKEILFWFRF